MKNPSQNKPQISVAARSDLASTAKLRAGINHGNVILAAEHARLMSASSTHAAFDLFVANELDALVGLRPRLVLDAGVLPGSRVLDGCFMATRQTIASPKGRDAGSKFLREFVEDAKASGMVARIVEKHGVRGVTVAPAVEI